MPPSPSPGRAYHRPSLAGGLEELVRSASGFATLDLDLLEEVLRLYALAKLWAAASCSGDGA